MIGLSVCSARMHTDCSGAWPLTDVIIISAAYHVKTGSRRWLGPKGLFPHGMGYFSPESYFNLNEKNPLPSIQISPNITEG